MQKIKDIYLVHLGNGLIGAYRPGRCPTIAYAPKDDFIDFVDSLREDYPEYRLRCVDNLGIRERIEKQVKIDRIILESCTKLYNI